MKTIVIQQERDAVIAEIKRDESVLRATVSKLHDVEELTVPTSLEDIVSPDWVRQQINPRLSLIKGDASLTADEQRQRLNLWLAIKQRVLRAIEKVAGILEQWPGLTWQSDSDNKNYHLNPSQVEELATLRATKPVPPQAEEHWRLITAMRLAVEQLRQFEHKHNLKDATLYQLSQLTQERLFELWLSGDIILKDYVVAGRKFIHPKTQQFFY